MSADHVLEPWFITGMGRKLVGGAGAYDWTVCGNKHECFATGDDGEDVPGGMVQTVVAHFVGVKGSEEAAKANAVRAVACVNAMKGIPTSALESGAIAELIAACAELEGWRSTPGCKCARCRINPLLAKLKETP